MKSLLELDVFGRITFAIKWRGTEKYLSLMLSTLGRTLFCLQSLPEHREKATDLHRCLYKPSLIPTMVRDQGPSATSSDLWCAGETSSKTPSCCPSSTSGIEEDKISVSSLSTLLYEAILVWSPSCGGQLSTRGLLWSPALWQGAGRCCYPQEEAVPQVQWRHLLPPEPFQSPGFQPGGFGQVCLRLHLPHHSIPHHPLHPPPRPLAFPLPSCPQPPSSFLPAPPAIPVCIPVCSVCLLPQHPSFHDSFLQVDWASHPQLSMGIKAPFPPPLFEVICSSWGFHEHWSSPRELEFSSASLQKDFIWGLGRQGRQSEGCLMKKGSVGFVAVHEVVRSGAGEGNPVEQDAHEAAGFWGAAVSGVSWAIKQSCLQHCPVRAWKWGQPLLQGSTKSLLFPWCPGQACPHLLCRGLRALEGAGPWREPSPGSCERTRQELCPALRSTEPVKPGRLPRARRAAPVRAWSWGLLQEEESLPWHFHSSGRNRRDWWLWAQERQRGDTALLGFDKPRQPATTCSYNPSLPHMHEKHYCGALSTLLHTY